MKVCSERVTKNFLKEHATFVTVDRESLSEEVMCELSLREIA
jgi:hypothetical protein